MDSGQSGTGRGGGGGLGGGGGGLLFVKEEVKPISADATKSLLSSSLATHPPAAAPSSGIMLHARVPMSPIKVEPRAPRRRHYSASLHDEAKTSPTTTPVHSPAFHGLTPPASVYRAYRARERSRSMPVAAAAAEVAPTTRAEDTGGFSVAHVIRAIVAGAADSSVTLDKPASAYQLRISEGSGSMKVDDDFPELDGTVELISVGVTTLLLVDANTERVLVSVALPEEVVGLRREQRAKLTAIDLTCQATGAAPFTVRVVSSLIHV